jgi:hypothetical protein
MTKFAKIEKPRAAVRFDEAAAAGLLGRAPPFVRASGVLASLAIPRKGCTGKTAYVAVRRSFRNLNSKRG